MDDIPTESENISNRAQILTSDASKLTAENITSASEVVGQIFNASRNAAPEVKFRRFQGKAGRREKKFPQVHSSYGMVWAKFRLLKPSLHSTIPKRSSK